MKRRTPMKTIIANQGLEIDQLKCEIDTLAASRSKLREELNAAKKELLDNYTQMEGIRKAEERAAEACRSRLIVIYPEFAHDSTIRNQSLNSYLLSPYNHNDECEQGREIPEQRIASEEALLLRYILNILS